MKKLLLAAQILLLPLHLLASNQIFESGSMVRLANPSAGINEVYWLFDSSNHYFGHYPPQAVPVGYSSYFEEGYYTLNSSVNNQFSAQLSSTAYGTHGTGETGLASRTATVTLTSPFSADYSGTRTEIVGYTESFNGNLTIYPAQDYAPEIMPIGSVWEINNAYYYSAYDSGPAGGSITVLSSTTLQKYDSVYGESYTGSYTYTKLGPNFGSIYFYDLVAGFSANINIFFRSPTEVYFYGDTTDPYGTYTDWGALDVTYPSSYSPPAIFSAPSALPHDQILQITGTNSDLSLDLAGGTWTDANGGSGSFTYTYAVQSGGVAGLTLNRTIQNVPASPEHFALRFTDDGVGEVVYSSLDGSQSFNLVDAPTWELYDDFSGSTIDTEKWETLAWGGGEVPFSLNGKVFFSGSQNTNTDVQGTLKEEYLAYYNNLGITELGPEPDSHSMLHFKNANFQNTHGVEFELSVSSTHQNAATGIGLFCYDEYQPNYGFFLDAWKSSGDGKLKLEFGIVGDDVLPGDQRFEYISDEWGYLDFIEIQYDTSYKIAYLMKNDTLCFYLDGVEVGQISYASSRPHSIATFRGVNESGDNFEATIDNVKILQESYEPPLPVVESYGNTDLLEDSSGYYAGSASTPLLYSGTQVSPTYPSATLTVVGVDLVNGTYRLILTNGSLYYAANFSLSGSSITTWAAVSDILIEEVNLQQDFDGDGYVGTPPVAPPASLAGKSFVLTQLTGGSKSVPDQAIFTADTFSYGFSGNLRASGVSYTYSNGTMLYGIEERIDFAFTSSTGGTYESGEVAPDGTFYIENTGTFEEANISLSLQTNWQRTETMDSELSTQYWQIESTSGDSAVYNDGELNFIFDPSSSPDPLAAYSDEQEIEIHYAGALPLDEDWQIVIDDTYVSDSVNQFAMGYQIMFQRSLYCEFGFLDQSSGRGVYFYADSYNSDTNQTDYYGDYYGPVVSITDDPRIQNGLNFRIQHLASTRELIYSYQPDGVSDWTELARINLSTGAATGLSGSGSLTGQLPSSSQNLSFGVDIDKYSTEAISIENIEIGGIEISTYTPPAPPASPESLVGYKLVGQFTEGLAYIYRHDFFFTGAGTLQGHYFVESNDPSFADDWSEETYTYQKTAATTGMLMITNSAGETTDVALTFDSATTGTAVANGRNGIRPISASGPFTFVEYEDSELPLPVVESYGNTDLLEDSSGYYAGSASTPLLYSGRQISRSYPGAGFTALGVDLVNGSYRVVLLYNGSQYYAANFALNGSNSSTWAVVANANVPAEEVKLQQDLNSDGYVGIAPPASLAGKQIEYEWNDGETSSVPSQELYGSDGYVQFGFSGSVLERTSYTYAPGVITYTDWGEEIRLSFTTPTSGTFEYYEVDYPTLDGGPNDIGTFTVVTPTLVLKNDWQRTETIDSPLSTDYWNIWRRTVDSVAYNAGELNFLFAGGEEFDYPEIELEYGRTLPLDENWQVVLNDAYGNSSLDDFEFELELEFDGQGYLFECELAFERSIFDGMSVSASFNSMTQGIDINGDGVIQTYTYAADLDGDGFVDLGNEVDIDGDGKFDLIDETTNFEAGAGGIDGQGNPIDIDINGDGVIAPFDLDGDGFTDLGNEFDVDGDGRFDIWDESNINENVTAYGYGSANVSALEDPRIEANVSLRITHNANSRELRFEYKPGEASTWEELARLNLETGAFESIYNSYGEGFSGQLVNPTDRLYLGIEAESNQVTALGDLKIGGIEIGSYTPPPPPASPENLLGYKLVGQFTEGTDIFRHDFFFTGSGTVQSHYFVESNDPSDVDDWSEETYVYTKTGTTTGTIAITDSTGETTDVELSFDSATNGLVMANGRNGNSPNFASGPFTFVEYDPSELPEPPLPVVESSGNTDLLEDDSGYYAGSAETPLLYSGRRVSRSYPGASFTALGVDLVNGSYRVVLLYNGSQYYAANFALNGSNSSTWAVVANVPAEEVKLQQDLNSDGYVGIAPPASLAGKAYQFSLGGGYTWTVPLELVFGSTTYDEGFAGSLLDADQPYTYANGVVTTDGGDEIRLTFTSATSGSFEYWELDDVGFYLEDVGTFNEVTPSLVLKNVWQRTENFDSPLSNDYWQVWRRSVDSLAYDDGELSFIFGDSTPGSDADTEVAYARTLPMDEDWQVVLDDIYASLSLENFYLQFELEIEEVDFECEFTFADYGSQGSAGTREVNVLLDQRDALGVWTTASAYVSANEDQGILSNVSLRILHTANIQELRFEYQPDGASEWSELARLNLSSGAFQSQHYTSGSNLAGGIVSATDHRMSVEIEARAGSATQVGDLEIGGIEIATYTPPVIPVDSDGDGLDDSVETNTGVYVSPSDTGTDPNNADTSGDGFTDAEAISASVDPNSDYGGLLNIVRQNPDRFNIFNNQPDPGSIVDMQIGSVGLERGADGNFDMNFDLEMSTDLQTWAPHTSHTIEISVPDQSKTFMRLNVK